MLAFRRLSLSRQYLVASLPILLGGMVVIGLWVTREIEDGVVHRLGAVTSLYVDSLVAPHLQMLLASDSLEDTHRLALDGLLTDTPLGQKIVAFNIWRSDGRVMYSTVAGVTGRTYPLGAGLATALRGDVYSKISLPSELEHGPVGTTRNDRLIETYTPVHAGAHGKVIGAAEFYQTTDELERETTAAKWRSWMVVAATMGMMYVLLFGLVRRGSEMIARQRRELHERVSELSTLLEHNAKLDIRVRGSAARATAINERFMRRLSADLHDGPGQDLGFALMRLETVANRYRQAASESGVPGALDDDFKAIRTGLEAALADLRAISAGLTLPEIDGLSTTEIAARAIRDYEYKSGAKVALSATGSARDVSLSVNITLYRLLQEALANGFRHANAMDQAVRLVLSDRELTVEVSDAGPGFDVDDVAVAGRIGLAGMRERIQALGGSFRLRSSPGHGTTITAILPTSVPGADHD